MQRLSDLQSLGKRKSEGAHSERDKQELTSGTTIEVTGLKSTS